jgi:hypothetical protein
MFIDGRIGRYRHISLGGAFESVCHNPDTFDKVTRIKRQFRKTAGQ